MGINNRRAILSTSRKIAAEEELIASLRAGEPARASERYRAVLFQIHGRVLNMLDQSLRSLCAQGTPDERRLSECQQVLKATSDDTQPTGDDAITGLVPLTR